MSIVKSFSVGVGDMFYIKHVTDNFTVIDCCLDDKNRVRIVNELIKESKGKSVTRFISTHPDEDHIQGIDYINSRWEIKNFYCVKNKATKRDVSESFKSYCELRDGSKAYNIYKGCTRKWMNVDSDERKNSGISIHWPNPSNKYFKEQLDFVEDGGSPNNISPIIQYNCGVKFMWMGDIETNFLEKVKEEIDFKNVDILFAPHHGRESGKIPTDILECLQPKIIVIGEAASKNLNYYSGYKTITQNSAGDITFDINSGSVDIYVEKSNYSVDYLEDRNKSKMSNYIGSL